MPNALLVEDDRVALRALTTLIETMGFSTITAATWADAKAELLRQSLDVVLLDVFLPGGSGIDLLLEIPKERRPQVVLMSGDEAVGKAFASVPMQELHFVPKPIDVAVLTRALDAVRRRCATDPAPPSAPRATGIARLLGASPVMSRVRELVAKVAPLDLSVYIEGESGTGKDLVALAMHEMSSRAQRPFVVLNCGALPESLIDSELFGHEKGAFTGAEHAKQGAFEAAHGGTLFLDEIAEMPIDSQVRLLRALETGRARRVGGTQEIEVDVRIVTSTNRRFDRAIAEGRFREDLFHRLCVFPIVTPPLREHAADIDLLAETFLAEIEHHTGRAKPFEADALACMRAYDWPGNVRQLRNAIQRAHIMADRTITRACLPEQIVEAVATSRQASAYSASTQQASAYSASTQPATTHSGTRIELDVGTSIADAERRLIEATLTRESGDKRAAAEILGVSLRTLYYRLKEYTGEDPASA